MATHSFTFLKLKNIDLIHSNIIYEITANIGVASPLYKKFCELNISVTYFTVNTSALIVYPTTAGYYCYECSFDGK